MEELEKKELEQEYKIAEIQETSVNPYIESDPFVGRNSYAPSDFLERGCHNCPCSYKPIKTSEMESCAKLHVTNWMKEIRKPFNENNFDCVEVRFKNTHKDFFRLPDGLEITEGDVVAVESATGHDLGIVTLTGELCRIQMLKHNIDPRSENIKRLYRRVKPSDIEKWASSIKNESNTLQRAKEIAAELSLNMKISDVEYQGDNSKAIFYYTADDRVDFRNLIKLLAEEFDVRIEMKQIGARQEAARLGGIGTCGRELCCSTWLNTFQSVSTGAARLQQLLPNPQKLAGQCGKLKCCLNYEYDVYADAMKDFPDTNIELRTQKGPGIHHKTDVFRRIMWYSYKNSSELFILTVDSVKEIIAKNKKNQVPESLENYATEILPKSDLIEDNFAPIIE